MRIVVLGGGFGGVTTARHLERRLRRRRDVEITLVNRENFFVLTPLLFEQLPLPAALYAVFVFPVVWGLTEQMTYNGYLVPRFRVLCRSTSLAVALVSIVWSFQHAVMPLTFDPTFMAVRALSPLPFCLFQTLLYLRLRRLIPFAIAHAVMDGASAFIGVLLPHLMP